VMVSTPGSPASRQNAVAVLSDFLAALETFDPERIIPFFADEAIVEFPFAVEGHPRFIRGIADITNFFGRAARVFKSIKFLDVEVFPMADPDLAFGEFRSSGVLTRGGIAFANTYVVSARVHNGHLVSYREFYDPQVIVTATTAQGASSRK
jgi:uncharacterized protein